MSFKSLKKFLLGMAIDCAVLCLVSQLCLTLCDPMICSPPGSSVHGILPARILKWVAYPFSRGSSQPRYQTALQVDSFLLELPAKPMAICYSSSKLTLSVGDGFELHEAWRMF